MTSQNSQFSTENPIILPPSQNSDSLSHLCKWILKQPNFNLFSRSQPTTHEISFEMTPTSPYEAIIIPTDSIPPQVFDNSTIYNSPTSEISFDFANEFSELSQDFINSTNSTNLENFLKSSSNERKRKRNTEAARRSRARKNETLSTLQQKITESGIINQHLALRILLLENEKNNKLKKISEHETRIKELELNLSECHNKLFEFCNSNKSGRFD